MTALGTRNLTLTIDGVEHTAEVSNVRIVSGAADSEFTTFKEAKEGGKREYRLAFTAAQDPATGTLWDTIWTAAGETIPFVIAPNGGEDPTPTTPHFTGNATVTEPDGDLLGGEANSSNTARFTFEAEWVCTAKPVRVTA